MKMGGIEDELKSQQVKARWSRLDRGMAVVGDEAASLTIIGLALAILIAPYALGIGLAWLLADWVGRATATPLLGWIAGITVFAFFFRYVWGSRLQRASRRAAEALVAKPDR